LGDLLVDDVHPLHHAPANVRVTALSLAERLAVGYDETDPFVSTWREELLLWPGG
jgi:hypothetical protein